MSKQFFTNDLVWAKMKGYPYWPGKIVEPPPCSKAKKKSAYVYFYGTENCAWINEESIILHNKEMLLKYKNKKGTFQKAIQRITEISVEKADSSEAESNQVDESEKEEKQNSDEEPKDDPVFFTDENVKDCVISFGRFLDQNSEDANISSKSYPPEPENLLKDVESITSDPGDFSKDTELPSVQPRPGDLSKKTELPSVPLEPEDLNADRALPSTSLELLSDPVIPHPDLMNNPIIPKKEKYKKRPPSPVLDFSKRAKLKEKIIPTKKKIGFVGHSEMAKRVIKNLAHSGHSLIVCNITDENFKTFLHKLKCKTASSPANVVKASDITFALFSDEDIAKNIVQSVLKEIEHSKVKKGYVEMTPMSADTAEMISTEISVKGGLYLAAQFVGSLTQASEGDLYINAGGDRVLYEDSKSCLDAISSHHTYVGLDVGKATNVNAVCNMMKGALNLGLAEIMSIAVAKGLGEQFIKILKITGLNSTFHVNQAEAMLKQNFQTQTSINEMMQHFNIGLAVGDSVSLSTPGLSMTKEAYKQARMLNYGEHDISAVIQATKAHE